MKWIITKRWLQSHQRPVASGPFDTLVEAEKKAEQLRKEIPDCIFSVKPML